MSEQFSDAQVEAACHTYIQATNVRRKSMNRDAMKVALAAASALAWRGIENAPADGRLIDVWRVPTDERPMLPVGRVPNAKKFRDGSWGYMVGPAQFNSLDDGVTHWRPLPDPPPLPAPPQDRP